ncbi:hypothetical protein SeLEV6574_g07923 [Synchytrium endobioticum]|uniref:Uncharacterized protein n=1 Tax=Synchytrium endobioticum TaxID=286115 RepID=A0A507CDR8_9FUNG|nr:hypothetical protein SeLEV6574_g07923 [Synchytrium endobioticum]
MADSYLEDDRVEIDLMTEEMSDMRSRIEEYRIRRGTAADDTERRRIDDETDKLRIELTQSQRDFRAFRRCHDYATIGYFAYLKLSSNASIII